MAYLYRCDHSGWYNKGPVLKGLDHPCSKCAKCITRSHLYDPKNCPACCQHLRSAQKSGPEGDHAKHQYSKWEGTMINKWRNSRVEEYLPTSVTSFIWASEEQKQAWKPPLRRIEERKRKRTSSSEKDSVRGEPSNTITAPLTLVTVEAEIHQPPPQNVITTPFIPPPPVSPIITANPTELPTGTFVVVEQHPGPSTSQEFNITAHLEAMEERMSRNIGALASLMDQSNKKHEARFAMLEKRPEPESPFLLPNPPQNVITTPTALNGVATQASEPQFHQPPLPSAQNGPSEEVTLALESAPPEQEESGNQPEPSSQTSAPSVPRDTNTVPLIDLTVGDEADTPPYHLKRSDLIHHQAHLWLQELYEEEEEEPDLFPHKNVLQHSSATKYFVSSQIKYSWFKKVPCLVTLWQMQTLALPVDQSWVKVRMEDDVLVYYLASPEAFIPAMYKPFLIKGTTTKPVPPAKGDAAVLKDFRPVFSQQIKEVTSLHPSESATPGWSSKNTGLLKEIQAIEQALPPLLKKWPAPIPMNVTEPNLQAYLTGPILQVREPTAEFKELFALLARDVDPNQFQTEQKHRHLAMAQCTLRESIRLTGELIERGSAYHTLKQEQAPTFAQLQTLQRDSSSFCLAQATQLFHFHMEAALKCKQEIVSALIARVEPMELRLLLRSASCICPHIFPVETMMKAQEIIARTLDTGLLRNELKSKIHRSSSSGHTNQPFRGSGSSQRFNRQGGYDRNYHQTTSSYQTRGNRRTTTRRSRGDRRAFSAPTTRPVRGFRGAKSTSLTSRPGEGSSHFYNSYRDSTPRGRTSSSRRGRRSRGSR